MRRSTPGSFLSQAPSQQQQHRSHGVPSPQQHLAHRQPRYDVGSSSSSSSQFGQVPSRQRTSSAKERDRSRQKKEEEEERKRKERIRIAKTRPEWGSRYVDMFTKQEQVGEGTYGYVSLRVCPPCFS
jgi:hypothetical protein